MNRRNLCGLAVMLAAVLLTGCPRGGEDNNLGAKAEALNDYDTALDYYNKALQTNPNSTEYRLRADRARFEAAQWHVDQGRRIRGVLEIVRIPSCQTPVDREAHDPDHDKQDQGRPCQGDAALISLIGLHVPPCLVPLTPGPLPCE